jgi:hypothetical protein
MSSKRAKPGRTLSLAPPEGQAWVWVTRTMLASITYRALGIHALRILDFLMAEHAGHGGRENGNLAAPYRQLEAWGVTSSDVRKGFEELFATGFVRVTRQGLRQAGGGEPSRYALTWLPTLAAGPNEGAPTHDWQAVIRRLQTKGIGSVAAARRWLRDEVRPKQRAVRRVRPLQKATPHLQVVSPLKCGATNAR